MKTRKIPQRKCVVCNEQKDKNDLFRVVKDKEGNVSLDPTGKMNGRGAYICKSLECLEKAEKKNSLNNALKTKISEEIYQEIENYVKMR